MDRERWQSYPVETPHDRLFLALLAIAGKGDERNVTAESDRGRRMLRLRREIAVEEPSGAAGTTGSVVARISFVGASPAEGERVVENLWALASEFLDAAEAEARGRLATAQSLSASEPPHGFEYVIDVIHDGMPHRFGIPGTRAKRAVDTKPAAAEPKAAPKRAARPPLPRPQLSRTAKATPKRTENRKPAKAATTKNPKGAALAKKVAPKKKDRGEAKKKTAAKKPKAAPKQKPAPRAKAKGKRR